MRFLEPIAKNAFDARAARHLLNRAGFGVPLSKVSEMMDAGLDKCINALVNYEQYTDQMVEPDWLVPTADYREQRQLMAMLDEDAQRMKRQEYQRAQRQAVERMKSWWLERMRTTNRPLQEKLTLFWHGHFAVAQEKVKNSEAIYHYYKVLRDGANGNFRDLVFEVGKSPAMLIYLDNRHNRKGQPNENWARELMELFTLGIGSYTEEDIKEAARAFTGYTIRKEGFTFVKNQHDYGEKEFLGRKGKFDGADVINIIMEQPQMALFISRKLWEYFVYENPSDELVEEMATVFRDAKLELKPLLAAIFSSKEFYSDRAVATQIKSPAQFMVQLLDQLFAQVPRQQMLNLAMRGLGQDLLNPPNVKGWDGNRAWINTNTLLLRYNIPAYMVNGERFDRQADPRLDDGEEGMGMMASNARARRQRAARMARSLVNTDQIYQQFAGKTVSEAADSIADYLLSRPLDANQKALFLESFGGDPNVQFNLKNVPRERLLGSLHLVLSTAEYQLC